MAPHTLAGVDPADFYTWQMIETMQALLTERAEYMRGR